MQEAQSNSTTTSYDTSWTHCRCHCTCKTRRQWHGLGGGNIHVTWLSLWNVIHVCKQDSSKVWLTDSDKTFLFTVRLLYHVWSPGGNNSDHCTYYGVKLVPVFVILTLGIHAVLTDHFIVPSSKYSYSNIKFTFLSNTSEHYSYWSWAKYIIWQLTCMMGPQMKPVLNQNLFKLLLSKS